MYNFLAVFEFYEAQQSRVLTHYDILLQPKLSTNTFYLPLSSIKQLQKLNLKVQKIVQLAV